MEAGSKGISGYCVDKKEIPMTDASEKYLLAGGSSELERVQLQARVWGPEVEVMLDYIGLEAGWRCLDLGCGALGILRPRRPRVGPTAPPTSMDLWPRPFAAVRS